MADRVYDPSFSDLAAEFLISLPRRRQRRALDCAYQLARDPFLCSDYSIEDKVGRLIEHMLIDGFIFSYWVDHAAKLVMIVEVDDASS